MAHIATNYLPIELPNWAASHDLTIPDSESRPFQLRHGLTQLQCPISSLSEEVESSRAKLHPGNTTCDLVDYGRQLPRPIDMKSAVTATPPFCSTSR